LRELRGDEPQIYFGKGLLSRKINIGVYLDFDNIWGGLLRELGIDPDERRKRGISLLSEEILLLKRIMNEILPLIFYEGISHRFTSTSYIPRGRYFEEIRKFGQVRYVKAFAVFSKLPFGDQVGDIQTILHNSGIEPFPSFIAKDTKDASDRSLILEVIEDIFFNRLPIDVVIIGSGDVDFYPLVSFFYEHSDKSLYILSFRNSKSSLYREIPLTMTKLIDIEDLQTGEESLEQVLIREKKIIFKEINEKFLKFRGLFLEKYRTYTGQNKEVKTGLVVKMWRRQWKEEEQIVFTESEINYLLDQLQNEGAIKIEPSNPGFPLRGKITLLKMED